MDLPQFITYRRSELSAASIARVEADWKKLKAYERCRLKAALMHIARAATVCASLVLWFLLPLSDVILLRCIGAVQRTYISTQKAFGRDRSAAKPDYRA
ncbi:MAG: hypothetical protein ACOVQK_12720 [Cyanobium sp.]